MKKIEVLATPSTLQAPLQTLANELEGELYYDDLIRTIYATDASMYKELPLAVALPKNKADLKALIIFARKHNLSLIPRTAGTSLAGQCVGEGIVVDVSKYFNKIIEFNATEGWVRVQPGVIRDDLNRFLEPHGYFFSPITSTANRAMIGGMVGNNSSGTTSIEYGTTREHVLELNTLLSDGSEVLFKEIDESGFEQKRMLDTLEGALYEQAYKALSNVEIQEEIAKEFPKVSIHRRNTGYALDMLLKRQPFAPKGEAFNFCQLLSGSEGTLALTTEIKLHVDPLPHPYNVLVAVHFNTIIDSMKATQFAMEHAPSACELMDKAILDCTKENITQRQNRFFIEGDPKAVLLVEFRGKSPEAAEQKVDALIAHLQEKEMGYAYSKVRPPRIKDVWILRSAGLGLLSNIPGDKKATTCVEDTAVALEDLADYIADFEEMLTGFGQSSVYYAHAGAGEIHIRPILNLKKTEEIKMFRDIARASAQLVKKYKGSLSGEHGDGRLRAEFIPMMVGQKNYQLFKEIKATWDPAGIFNPGKIVDAPEMNTSLRYKGEQETPDFDTLFDFSEAGGMLRMAEKCNGSGDCRKLPDAGGTMCPSYQATRNEKDSTRARANTLREYLTKNTGPNPFDHQEIKEVLDLCLSCKGCTSECPSNVDMASLKAEFLHQYHKTNKPSLRDKAFARLNQLNQLGAAVRPLTNLMLKQKALKNFLGIAPERDLPLLQKQSTRQWYSKHYETPTNPIKSVYLFCDEFTNYNDAHVGIKSIRLLTHLGYHVQLVEHPESGRAALSKGFLDMAKEFAIANVKLFAELIGENTPLIGIEPSALLSFRDEYPRLVPDAIKGKAKSLAKHCLLIDEFIAQEAEYGNIGTDQFTDTPKSIMLHGHCHQKSLSGIAPTVSMLSLPVQYAVQVIPSGCCGMAGSFGYEKEHYDISMQIGELQVLPAVRKATTDTLIVAPGTSCRHQIADGAGKKALHPVEVLWEACME